MATISIQKQLKFLSSLALGVILITLAVSRFSQAIPQPTDALKPKPSVAIIQSEVKPISDVLTYPARVHSRVNANVLSEADGFIAQLITPLGTAVTQFTPLAVLKHTDPVYQYAPLKISSPISGVVSQVDVTEGSRVAKGQKLFTITDPKKILVIVEVASVDLEALKDKPATFLRLASFEKETIPLQIRGISPFVDSSTGTATAELEIKIGTQTSLYPGSVGQVEFQTRPRNGIILPEDAIVLKDQKSMVRSVITDPTGKKKIQFQEIKLGKTQKGFVEVLSGLKDGVQIVVRSSQNLNEGDEVTITQ